jgi:hypothetical protein
MTRLAFVAFALTSALASGCAADDAPADAGVASVGVVAGADAVVGAVAEAARSRSTSAAGAQPASVEIATAARSIFMGSPRRRACGNAAK